MNTCECGCGQSVASAKRRFVHGHNGRLLAVRECSVVTCHVPAHGNGMCGRHNARMTQHGQLYPVTRKFNRELWFWAHVAIPQEPDGCWIWLGDLDESGYGRAVSMMLSPTRTKMAHRWTYEQRIGPIPEGLHLDHLCRIRCCVNPEHLEPVTVAENVRRGVHGELREMCVHRHPVTAANTYLRRSDNTRRCRDCGALEMRAKRARETAMGLARPMGSERDFEASLLYQQGWIVKELAQRYGVSVDRMGTILRLTGTPFRRPGARPSALRQQAKTIRSEHRNLGYGGAA